MSDVERRVADFFAAKLMDFCAREEIYRAPSSLRDCVTMATKWAVEAHREAATPNV